MPPQEETYFENALRKLEIKNIQYFQSSKASESDILEYTGIEYTGIPENLHTDKLYESLPCSDLNRINKSHLQ